MSTDRKLNRRRFVKFGIAGVGAVFLGACQPKQPAVVKETVIVEGTPQVVEKTVQVTVAPKATVEVTWWFWVGSEKDKEWLKPLGEMFAERNPGYVLKMETPSSEGYREKIMAMIASGNPPEHFQLDGLDWYHELIEADQLVDLTDVAAELNVETEELPLQRVVSEVDGKYYGLTTICHTFGIFYNVDMFKAAGVKTPMEQWQAGDWTWDTFLDTCQALSTGPEDARETYGYLINEWADWNGWIWSAGGTEVDRDYPVTKVLLDSEEAKEGLRFVQDLRCKYKVSPTPDIWQGGFDPFQTGKVAMQWMGTWVRYPWVTELKFDWQVAPFPLHPVRKKPFQYGHVAMRANSKNAPPEKREGAIRWVKFDHSLDAQKLEAASFSVLPINKTIATSDATLRAGEQYGKVLDNWVFIDGIENARIDPFDPAFRRVKDEVIQPEADLYWNCQLSADEFVAKVVATANEKLGG